MYVYESDDPGLKNPALSINSCVSLGLSLNLSDPHFRHW